MTIEDNEELPTITIDETDANAAGAGQNPGGMRITRTGGNNTPALTVSMSTTGSEALNGADYVNVPNTVSIPAGAASVCLTFTPVDDAVVEGAEEIVRTINPNSNYIVGNPNSATLKHHRQRPGMCDGDLPEYAKFCIFSLI